MNKKSEYGLRYIKTIKASAKVLNKETVPILRALTNGRAKDDYHYETTFELSEGVIATSYSKVLYCMVKKDQEYSVTVQFYRLPDGNILIQI